VSAEADIAAAKRFSEHFDFPTLVDTENRLAAVFGYRVIPNGYLYAADGILLNEVMADFDIRDQRIADLVRGWLAADVAASRKSFGRVVTDADSRALELFAEGTKLLEQGQRQRGLARWHAAHLADPKSFVISEQIWRALYPERFGDPIDIDWQDVQIRRERELGFGVANPSMPPASLE
jgi:hypothetical protein